MNKITLLFFIILMAGSFVVLPTAYAAKTAKASKAVQLTKERLVLMPLRTGEDIQNMQGAMETALAQGLQQQYTVFAGEDVAKKTREIFKKESAKKNCDETRCMENIAIAFQSELVAVANVTKIEGGYLLALSIRNVMDNKAIYNNSLPCKNCDAFQVVEKLKELAGAPVAVPVVAAPAAEPLQAKVILKDPDGALWAEVDKGGNVEDYQVYLDSFPKGKYLPLAKARIKKIKDAAQAAAEQHEQQAWDTAQKESSEASFALYLKGFPNGRFAGLAKVRMDKFKSEVTAREERSKKESVAKNTFDHMKTKYPLSAEVINSKSCGSCHDKDDNHNGDFGPQCSRCHVGATWKVLKVGNR